jgi:hypothetical protein
LLLSFLLPTVLRPCGVLSPAFGIVFAFIFMGFCLFCEWGSSRSKFDVASFINSKECVILTRKGLLGDYSSLDLGSYACFLVLLGLCWIPFLFDSLMLQIS